MVKCPMCNEQAIGCGPCTKQDISREQIQLGYKPNRQYTPSSVFYRCRNGHSWYGGG